jgi:hypothetical protein
MVSTVHITHILTNKHTSIHFEIKLTLMYVSFTDKYTKDILLTDNEYIFHNSISKYQRNCK